MLIELTIARFRSILEPQTLSLVAPPGGQHSAGPLPGAPAAPPLLRCAAICGPNASGKSHLLQAVAALRDLIARSATCPQPGEPLQRIVPFLWMPAAALQPAQLEILFIAHDGVRYRYTLAVDRQRVHSESLLAYPGARPQRWFERTYDEHKGEYDWWLAPQLQAGRAQRRLYRELTPAHALFLSSAIRLNNDPLKPAFDWLTRSLLVLDARPPGGHLAFTLELLRERAGQQQLLRFLRQADIDIEHLELIEQPGTRARLRAWHKLPGASGGAIAWDIQEESSGTVRLLELAGAVICALRSGATLWVDDLDRSLHPLTRRFLISRFVGPANPLPAQLLFTAHRLSPPEAQLLGEQQIWLTHRQANRSCGLRRRAHAAPRRTPR